MPTKYPVVGDFNITGLVAYYSGTPKEVTITPKDNKSNGSITVYYDGDTTPPTATGIYPVTFDVAEDDGYFYAVTGLSAGDLVINPKYNPVVGDFNIEGLRQRFDETPKTVTITPKENIPAGDITVFYNSSLTPPTEVGYYAVTFNITATESSNGAEQILAGILEIYEHTPVASDFNVTGLAQDYDGNPKAVTITPKENMSTGTITVKYNGSNTAPTNAGSYTVTYDVAAATGFNAATNLSAGTLIITITPTASDYNITGTGVFEYNGTTKTVSITAKDYLPSGGVTVYYNGSTTPPRLGGVYTVTFNVMQTTGRNAVNNLYAGTITINRYPVASDFNISGTGVFDYDGTAKTVTITPKAGMSTGVKTIYYDGSITPPIAVGTYPVTFDVAAATGFNAVTGLYAGTISIGNFDHVVSFNSNGGTDVSPIGVMNGGIIDAPTPPTKIGYAFNNWYTDTALTQAFTFGDGGDAVTTTITLYAKWTLALDLGDTGPGGGKIFYRSEEGFIMTDTGERCHYLEAAPAGWYGTGNDPYLVWSNNRYSVDTGTAIGTGRNNTALIITGDTYGYGAPAAEACVGYENNGMSDWFLPSVDELNALWTYWDGNDRNSGNSFGVWGVITGLLRRTLVIARGPSASPMAIGTTTSRPTSTVSVPSGLFS